MLNELAQKIYDFNKSVGWHSEPPDLPRYLMGIHSEISELWEADRAGRLTSACDKTERLTNLEEEFADIIIRSLGAARAFSVDIDRAVRIKMAYNAMRPHHGGKLE